MRPERFAKGLLGVLATPFTDEGQLDETSTEPQVELHRLAGSVGLVALTTQLTTVHEATPAVATRGEPRSPAEDRARYRQSQHFSTGTPGVVVISDDDHLECHIAGIGTLGNPGRSEAGGEEAR